MRTDALPELQEQVVAGAAGALALSVAWLLLLLGVALRHRRSPAVAARALARLGAPRLLVRVLVLLVGLGLAAPAHASAMPGRATGVDDPPPTSATATTSATRLAEALDGLPVPSLPAPGPPVQVQVGPGRATTAARDGSAPALDVTTSRRPGPASRPDTRRPLATHHVARGESLWSISAARLPGADDAAVARAWRLVHAANRDVVGADPDLVTIGTRLDLRVLGEVRADLPTHHTDQELP